MRKITEKPFADWQAEEVEKTFGITRLDTLSILEHFNTLRLTDSHPHRAVLEQYRREALWLIEAWNEDEYKFLFISPFLKLVNFTNRVYNVFTQRTISVSYDNDTKTTSGRVEWMLARGRQIPEQPHFFLHEYKPEKNRDNDPLGQLLIAMVAAGKVNADDKPIYGVYVNGRNWFFVAFTGAAYAVSNPYVITTDDIFDLFAVLEFLRSEMDIMYGVGQTKL
jgi:hypothetical protein